ncbi:MAG: DUF3152 domain-containing protein, partial [bacterium]|nr:DUF3152 domain-containing protein [bacterium]
APTMARLAPATAPVEAAAPVVSPFVDVVAGREIFAREIVWLAEQGISTGWPDGTFRPYEPVLRDSMAAFLHRFSGSPAWGNSASLSMFWDVVPGSLIFYREITWLAATGITTGWPGGSFGPFGPVNRDQMAAFLYRLAGSPAYSPPTTSPFVDVPTTHPFYRQIAWMAETGISTGWPDRTFRPFEPIKRDATAVFLHRFSERFAPAVAATPPASNVACGTLTHGGCFQVRESGVAFGTSPDALFQPAGAIGVRWRAAGGASSGLRHPTSAERCGLASGGCVQAFQRGSIYWSPGTGAQIMWAGTALTSFWQARGAESGSLGYPTGEETCSGTRCTQSFQRGTVVWTPDGGARLRDSVTGPIPWSAAGTRTVVPGSDPGRGSGGLLTYQVEIENGLPIDHQAFANEVHTILNDPRGWRRDFARVSSGGTVRLILASPTYVDRLCAPLDTNGYTSCRRGNHVIINANRWAYNAQPFVAAGGSLTQYREYVINHEMGHALGNGHRQCSGSGALAHVMQQQTLTTLPCRPNGWPNP